MKSVRIGNGCGFWGDNLDAPIHLARDGRLDYLTLEYLAELTMSILAAQKAKDPAAGFASDFLDVLARLVPILKQQPNLKIVTNAGGMNPHGCAQKARAILSKAGLADRKIGIVSGDDLMSRLDRGLSHLDTGEPLASIRDKVVSANAYLGAKPIVEALALGFLVSWVQVALTLLVGGGAGSYFYFKHHADTSTPVQKVAAWQYAASGGGAVVGLGLLAYGLVFTDSLEMKPLVDSAAPQTKSAQLQLGATPIPGGLAAGASARF